MRPIPVFWMLRSFATESGETSRVVILTVGRPLRLLLRTGLRPLETVFLVVGFCGLATIWTGVTVKGRCLFSCCRTWLRFEILAWLGFTTTLMLEDDLIFWFVRTTLGFTTTFFGIVSLYQVI